MAEGPADVGSPFDSALSDEHCAKQYELYRSSRVASSPTDLDIRKISWVFASETSCFLELNGHCAAVLVLRPLQPGVCHLGDFTGRFLPRDGRTGLKLITKSRVKSSLVPRPFCYTHAWERKEGSGKYYTPARALEFDLHVPLSGCG